MLKYQNVLVPLDTSSLSELALAKAVAVAKRNDAHLDLLSVIDTQRSSSSYFGSMMTSDLVDKLVGDATKYLDNLVKQIKDDYGLTDVATHVRFGNPKTVISLEFIHDHKNDLVMMGATGMTAMERVLTGSVTDFVTRNAPCDVLVVRTDVANTSTSDKTSPFRKETDNK
ncbi:hypothetical protein AYR62_00250 [Secundilactobacillus paracollinoides]|uniref:UspA domain-containing protein n=1 Tax=Secundilactobacillus paracollinoides TaxID=240427 RepID=A0A1B2IVV5_9LACO|nr:universal stress protein [Secundilactobacillus paracollinoides]ANZ62682.1 hypothetical protein AYR62_00250 [Secundilactobacillus paracollinoides]ANZ66159.1 hypothetical protein AYR63_02705 [Secundilactobacillus paracollinoides]KRL75101.1 UspA domain-containing protein [Secundilactobacillus paracollinoides DSM 15502 = JCM 11969]